MRSDGWCGDGGNYDRARGPSHDDGAVTVFWERPPIATRLLWLITHGRPGRGRAPGGRSHKASCPRRAMGLATIRALRQQRIPRRLRRIATAGRLDHRNQYPTT